MYDSDAPRRDQAGLKEIRVSSKTDDPNNVYLIWETNEPSVINKMLNDPDLQEKMKEGGVVGKPEVIILN